MKLAGPVKSGEGSTTPRKQQVQRPWGELRPPGLPFCSILLGESWGLQQATV